MRQYGYNVLTAIDKFTVPYSDIIDNRNVKLRDEINSILGSSERVKFAVGYLYLSGFYQIAEKLDKILNEFFPQHLVPLLKRLNKGTYSDEQYLNELIDIYNKEKLSEITGKSRLSQKEGPLEFICGEILA